jgi:hypothetical protein
LRLAGPPAPGADEVTLTLAFERADGLERVGFLCAVARAIAGSAGDFGDGGGSGAEALLARLAPWLEREFEQTREAALKSLRAERRPLVMRFDREHPGPFAE